MSNPSDPRYPKGSNNHNSPQIDKTFVEGSASAQPIQELRPGTKVNATSIGASNPYTSVPGLTQSGSIGNMTIDMLPTGNEPIPLGSGTIVSLLGSGGMARVYKIWNEKLEVFRATKILIPGQTELKNRFDTEAKITAKLHHPNIVEIYNVGDWNNLPYLEMEYIDGDSLEAFIAKYGVLPPSVCSSIAIFVARALAYAHCQEFLIYGKNYHGVVHRDLKPANIMIMLSGNVRLMDFGIARPTEASLHTVEGNIVGTMQYLSPEQLDGVDIDGRTDIYSFGAILYEMLTGTKTFPQDTITNLMKKKIMNEYRRFSDFDFNISPALSKISQKCLQIKKEDRFPNVEALLRELETVHRTLTSDPPGKVLKMFLNDPESVKSTSKQMSIRLSPKVLLPVLGGVVLAGVVTFVLLTGPEKENNNQPTSTQTNDSTAMKNAADKSDSIAAIQAAIKADSIKKHIEPDIVKTPPKQPDKKPPSLPKYTSTISTPKPPVPPYIPADPVPELSPIERLQKKYNATDPVMIGKKALAARSYQDAITVLESTPANHPEYKLKTLLLLQAYIETSKTKDALFIATANL